MTINLQNLVPNAVEMATATVGRKEIYRGYLSFNTKINSNTTVIIEIRMEGTRENPAQFEIFSREKTFNLVLEEVLSVD